MDVNLTKIKEWINRIYDVGTTVEMYISRTLRGIPIDILPAGKYEVEAPKYRGMWVGYYDTEVPTLNSMIKQECSYEYTSIMSLAKKLKELAETTAIRSLEVKYFVECIIGRYPHTIIWVHRAYSDGTIDYMNNPKFVYSKVKDLREVEIIPFMRNGKPIRWLKASQGWNRHCKYWLGYDACYTQHFVKSASYY